MPGLLSVLDDGIADRLHEAVDQRRLQVGAGGVDAAGRDETVFLRPQELGFPVGAISFLFDLGGARATRLHVVNIGFLALGVLFNQHLAGNFLFRAGGEFRWCGSSVSESCSARFAHQLILWLLVFEWSESTISSGSIQCLDYIRFSAAPGMPMSWLKKARKYNGQNVSN